MAKKSDLLQEAIADAKAVRELALENAKEALKEAFTPKLQSMLSAKIQQEMEDMDDMDHKDKDYKKKYKDKEGDYMEEADYMDMDHKDKDYKKKYKDKEGEDYMGEAGYDHGGYDDEKSNDPKDLNQFSTPKKPQPTPDFKEDIDEGAYLKTSGIGDADNKEPSKLTHGDEKSTEDIEGIHPGSKPAKEDDYSVPDKSKYGMEEGVDESELDEELDLESIIKELEEDYDYMEDDYMDDEEGEGEVDYGQEEPAVDYGAEKPEMDYGDGEDDDIDIDLDDEEGEERYRENVDEKVEEEKVEERRESGYEDGHEEKLADIDEALASIKNAETIKELEMKVTQLEAKLDAKDTIVKEYYDGVKYLKEKLNEVNVLNAKLLFTNKLFRNFNLDQKGKLRVIENFDRAQNIREIKLVFTTLAENLKSTQLVSQAKKQQVKRITEGASKVTQTTKPSEELLKEEDNVLPDFVVRAQKLAGITK